MLNGFFEGFDLGLVGKTLELTIADDLAVRLGRRNGWFIAAFRGARCRQGTVPHSGKPLRTPRTKECRHCGRQWYHRGRLTGLDPSAAV
jgi:hypothetical protein